MKPATKIIFLDTEEELILEEPIQFNDDQLFVRNGKPYELFRATVSFDKSELFTSPHFIYKLRPLKLDVRELL